MHLEVAMKTTTKAYKRMPRHVNENAPCNLMGNSHLKVKLLEPCHPLRLQLVA